MSHPAISSQSAASKIMWMHAHRTKIREPKMAAMKFVKYSSLFLLKSTTQIQITSILTAKQNQEQNKPLLCHQTCLFRNTKHCYTWERKTNNRQSVMVIAPQTTTANPSTTNTRNRFKQNNTKSKRKERHPVHLMHNPASYRFFRNIWICYDGNKDVWALWGLAVHSAPCWK